MYSKNILRITALTALLAVGNAYATGLGKITVLSSRGQPLRAEIELSSPDQIDIPTLVANIAPIETFKKADVEFNPVLQSLRFTVEPRGSGYVVRITSAQAINEGYLDFFVELNTANGKLVREYTVVLSDSVGTQSAQLSPVGRSPTPSNVVTAVIDKPAPKEIKEVAVVKDIPKVSQKQDPVVTSKNKVTELKKSAPIKTENRGNKAQSLEYKIKSGDTLIGIARTNADGILLDQMMVSIYQENEDAFVAANMNRLKAGKIITIPSSESIRANPIQNARKVIQAHSSNFHGYQTKLAETVSRTASAKSAAATQSSTGAVTTKVNEKSTATTGAVDQLKLSKVNKDAPSKGSKESKNQFKEEDAIAKARALEEANARLRELEKNVGELDKIVAAKNSATPSAVNVPTASATLTNAKASSLPKVPVKAPPKPPVVNDDDWLSMLKEWVDTKFLIGAALSALLSLIVVLAMKRKAKPNNIDHSVE